MRRPATIPRLAVAVAVVIASCALAAAAPASAALMFAPCPGDGNRCATLAVALDPSGALPGSVELHVERERGTGAINSTIVELAGGPGQAATPLLEDTFDELGISDAGRQIVAFDQRGTGRSGLLRCPLLEHADQLSSTAAAAACAASLGARRGVYTTADSVADLEALRAALGVQRISLYAVSYGTKLALDYARAYPTHVDRMVLDSTLPPQGEDPLYRDSYAAIPRILAQRCAGACSSFTPDPGAELHALVERLAVAPLRGVVIDPDGRPRRYSLGREQLLALLFGGDFDDALRRPFAADVHAALLGDPAPLLRLGRAGVAEETAYTPPEELSSAVYAATLCEELAFPWSRSDPLADRPGQAAATIAALGDSPFYPFDAATALGSDEIRLCLQWPNADPAPEPPAPLPDVPTLIISGGSDTRTPTEDALAVHAAIPRSALVIVPNSGHSVLGENPDIQCPRRAVRELFASPPLLVSRRCPASEIALPPAAAPPPESLADVRPAAGSSGLAGRTAAAMALTLVDAGEALALSSGADGQPAGAAGGLRGGRIVIGRRGVVLQRYVFIPGVIVDGALPRPGAPGVLTVSGAAAARGVLVLRDGLATGRLGGVAVRVRLGPSNHESPRLRSS